VVSRTPRPYFGPEKDPLPIVHEAELAPGPVWTGAENLDPTGIRSPDRAARSSVTIPTELPDPQNLTRIMGNLHEDIFAFIIIFR
jgi:hypothetical protein